MGKIINAVMWLYGFTSAEARAYIANSSASTLAEIVKAYEQNAVKAFYND